MSCSFVRIIDVDRMSIFYVSLVNFLAHPRLFDPTDEAFVKLFLYLTSKTSPFFFIWLGQIGSYKNNHKDIKSNVGNIVNNTIIIMCGVTWVLDLLK